MKKCYSLLRCTACTGCAQQTAVQNKPAIKTLSKPSPIISSFLNWAEKTVDAAKICGGAENVVKTKPANIRKWIAPVLLLWAFILRWKRVCIAHNNCMSCPSIWATLSTALINILLGSFQLFLHSDQPLSEGWNVPFSSVCQSGGLHYPRRRRC